MLSGGCIMLWYGSPSPATPTSANSNVSKTKPYASPQARFSNPTYSTSTLKLKFSPYPITCPCSAPSSSQVPYGQSTRPTHRSPKTQAPDPENRSSKPPSAPTLPRSWRTTARSTRPTTAPPSAASTLPPLPITSPTKNGTKCSSSALPASPPLRLPSHDFTAQHCPSFAQANARA